MEIWTHWLALLQYGLESLSHQFGLTQAGAIILLTLIVRTAVMPLAIKAALNTQRNRQKMAALEPELQGLKARHAADPKALAGATMALYRAHGIRLIDRLSVLNMGWQGLFGLGIFQVLSAATASSRFLWIANLARPDLLLSLLVSALMVASMLLMPNATAETSMLVMLTVSAVVGLLATMALPASVGLFWASANVAGVVQAGVVRRLLARQRAFDG